MKRLTAFVITAAVLAAICFQPLGAREDANLNKGIAYLLVNDPGQAGKYFALYFRGGINPNIVNGFKQLMEGNNKAATRHFKTFLDMDHRSVTALVGISLSTSTMEVSNSSELLKRAIRLDRRFSPAYLCLGMEYLKDKNYPQAIANFRQAMNRGRVPEYKILPAKLYLELGNPAAVLGLLKKEADAAPDNFYFNFLTAKALLLLNRSDELGPYIEAAGESNPTNKEAKLLTAQYYLSQNDPQKARLLLKGIIFNDYNEDYMKTFATVLVRLKDKKADNYLHEVFSRKKWDKEINLLMGLYHLSIGRGGNVQNWVYRSILCGHDIERLKKLFPEDNKFPRYKSLPFFDIARMEWLSNDKLLVVGVAKSGERERIFIVDPEKMRTVQTMNYRGKLQEIFISPKRNAVIVSTVAGDNESVNLYAVDAGARVLRLRPLMRRPLRVAAVTVGFNSAGTMAYISDNRINSIAFESPFSQVSQYGDKKPVYPNYPFYIYKYYFATGRMVTLKDLSKLDTVPSIDGVRKYSLVSDAMYADSQIQSLVETGQQLDITSSEMVNILFGRDLTSFVIYLSDMSNAFKGYAWDKLDNKALPVDETMFLGKGKYAELSVLDIAPERKEILVVTKKQKELFLYNYESHLFLRLGNNVSQVHYDREDRTICVLETSGNNGRRRTGGSGLHVISLDPYLDVSVGTKLPLTGIVDYVSSDEILFRTADGELVKMDGEYKFSYVKPSWEGCLHADAPSGKRTMAFINYRLWLVE